MALERPSTALLFTICLGLLIPTGCDKDKGKGEEEVAGKDQRKDGDEGKGEGEGEGEGDDDDAAVEDEGSVELTIGDAGAKWIAKRATAEPNGKGAMRIQASVHAQDSESASGAQFKLLLWDFEGPGEYVLRGPNSTLAGLKIDLDEDGKATRGAVKSGISGGRAIVFQNAKVQVTRATDDFVDGTLTWSGVALGGATKVDGKFHARIEG
ncbi:hypothetical protein ENSA5_36810 [Enhygromyxa salina]|uniref:Uncharacterized protein n=1 Tax=Enhygromyxa salina TaxID=215803 RepID=A0A2S9XSH2_9BACT|nr:hypothetical protein [Enhygromyxa salina]PRP95812.1 hypothetical protein ENSA5_36810 [Enhygromyxa salina]